LHLISPEKVVFAVVKTYEFLANLGPVLFAVSCPKWSYLKTIQTLQSEHKRWIQFALKVIENLEQSKFNWKFFMLSINPLLAY